MSPSSKAPLGKKAAKTKQSTLQCPANTFQLHKPHWKTFFLQFTFSRGLCVCHTFWFCSFFTPPHPHPLHTLILSTIVMKNSVGPNAGLPHWAKFVYRRSLKQDLWISHSRHLRGWNVYLKPQKHNVLVSAVVNEQPRDVVKCLRSYSGPVILEWNVKEKNK